MENGRTDATNPEMDRVETPKEYNLGLKRTLGDKYNSTLIDYEELINIAPDFALWLKEIVQYGRVDSQVLIYLDTKVAGINRFVCKLFTNDNIYAISGNMPTEIKPKGYLGCIASTRKNRVGEDWNRGSDLPDGEYSKETFDAIVRRIVAYEILNLELWREE